MSDFSDMFPERAAGICLTPGTELMVAAITVDGPRHYHFDSGGALVGTVIPDATNDPPHIYRDEYGRAYDTTCCQCGHDKDQHDDTGLCQSGDDDGDGYFDHCYCDTFEDRRLG